MSLVEISRVSKQFRRQGPKVEGSGKFFALNDVSLSVRDGEILGILGPNGAGKTTLLNILLGIIYSDSGTVKIFGQDIRKTSLGGRIGYVSGEERFHWAMSVLDIMNFGGILCGLGSSERKASVGELVEAFGLKKVLNSKFDVLSTGEKMRLALAYALISKPGLLLLDEPTLGLDPDIAIRVRKEIRRINKKLGTTIILTSHYMKEVEELCDRVAFISKGRVMHIGTVSEIRKKYPNLEDYFVKMTRKAEPDGE